MTLGEKCPTVYGIMASMLSKYITLPANDCGYCVTAEELIVNYFDHFFLRPIPPQFERMIQIGARPQLEYLMTIIGKQ